MTNFNEFHSHRWAKNFKDARDRFSASRQSFGRASAGLRQAQPLSLPKGSAPELAEGLRAAGLRQAQPLSLPKGEAEPLFSQNKIKDAREQLTGLVQGDFADPKHIFPGLKIMAPYWKAEEEMMRCRFEEMTRQFAQLTPAKPGDNLTDTTEFKELVKKYYDRFVEDVRTLLKSASSGLPETSYAGLLKTYPPMMPADWADTLKAFVQESEQASESGMSESLFQRWLVFCLNGIIAYNYGLIRQAVFSGLIILKYGEDRLKETVARTRDEYGWRVSRAFFLEIFPAAGISDAADLQVVGRYGMFSDQEIFSREILPPSPDVTSGDSAVAPPEKRTEEPKIKITEFLNCQEFSIFQTIFKDMEVPAKEVGPAICLYCEEHGRKNTQLFVPHSLRPELKLVQSFGFSAQKCIFETKLYPANDMERFLKAQEKLYG